MPRSRPCISPGHDALAFLSELVALLDNNPIARQYVKATGKYLELELRARELVDSWVHPARSRRDGSDEIAPGGERFAWCGSCRAYHKTLDPFEVKDSHDATL